MTSYRRLIPMSFPAIQRSGQQRRTKPAASSSTARRPSSFDQGLSSFNQSQVETDDLVQKLWMGENVDLHQVMIGLEENDVNFRVALAIRDKLVEAYHEVMRMQI